MNNKLFLFYQLFTFHLTKKSFIQPNTLKKKWGRGTWAWENKKRKKRGQVLLNKRDNQDEFSWIWYYKY